MKRWVSLLVLVLFGLQSTASLSAAPTGPINTTLYPQKTVQLSVADQAAYMAHTPYVNQVAADQSTVVDSQRLGTPAWTVNGQNYSDPNSWVAAKFTFDTKTILACTNAAVSVRQFGAYAWSALNTNSAASAANDAKQLLVANGQSLQILKASGGLSPGATKQQSLNGARLSLNRTQLNNLEMIVMVQAKDAGQVMNWSVDNLRLGVEYQNNCSVGSNRYNRAVFSGIDEYTNIAYRTTTLDNGQPVTLKLDVFRPKGDNLKYRPLLVFVHGGGYAWGSKEDINYAARWYAKAGYTTASIDYRLMTNPPAQPSFDDMLRAMNNSDADTKDALRFLSKKSAVYGIDTNKVGVIGWSAGGATALAQQLARPINDPQSQFNTFAANTHALVSGSGYLGPPVFPEIKAKKPSVLMINWQTDTANSDEMNANNNAFAHQTCDAFTSAGVSCQLVLKPGSGHDIDFIAEASKILPFLKQQLKP